MVELVSIPLWCDYSVLPDAGEQVQMLFQFLYGAIIADAALEDKGYDYLFQFLYGAIIART